MASNDRVAELDFNALVVRCAGPDKEDQVAYLARVVMKLLIQLFASSKMFSVPLEFAKRIRGSP